MRKVLVENLENVPIYLEDVAEGMPIFAKKDGKLIGMVVYENNCWKVSVGKNYGATGYHKTRSECLESCIPHGYEFFIED